MRENSPIGEDVIVKRVQRRLERYFSDLEMPKSSHDSLSNEAAATKIVSIAVIEESLKTGSTPVPLKPVTQVLEAKAAAFAPPPIKVTSPLPKAEMTASAKPPSPNSAPRVPGQMSEPELSGSFGGFPKSILEPKISVKSASSFLPIFVFFLAMVAVLGLLLAWFWFTGGTSDLLPQ